ncbi:hypothetical protein Syun_001835 [Stephania yunnanensis]|uniref:Uncharacterized protein n=1 Tax=Stephania yunnanensis TaxID=152371 RepID=A0AAP0LHI0_9MAGN
MAMLWHSQGTNQTRLFMPGYKLRLHNQLQVGLTVLGDYTKKNKQYLEIFGDCFQVLNLLVFCCIMFLYIALGF